MITKLDIENFKDFRALSLRDLKQVTLISGKNNIGKTSILEAILLLFNYKVSSLLVPILGNRLVNGFPVNVPFDHAVTGIFNDYDVKKRIAIKSNNDEIIIKLVHDAKLLVQQNSNPPNINNILTAPVITDGLKIEYKQSGNQYYSGTSLKNTIQENFYLPHVQSGVVHPVKLPPVIVINEFGELLKADDFINNSIQINTASSKQQALVREFNNIRTNHRKLIKEYLIPGLKLLNPAIEDIELGNEPLNNQESRIELILEGGNRPIPLSSLGHGAKRLFNIIIGTISAKDGILLIDEIENGIHYSIISEMWDLIFKLAKANNCQIIAVTHSWEFASYVTSQPEENQKLFSFVNIARLKNGDLSSATYNFEQFAYAIESNSELR